MLDVRCVFIHFCQQSYLCLVLTTFGQQKNKKPTQRERISDGNKISENLKWGNLLRSIPTRKSVAEEEESTDASSLHKLSGDSQKT